MRSFRFLLAAATLFSVLLTAETVSAAPSKGAELGAMRWLGLIDAGHYLASWRASAPLFQSRVDAATWKNMVKTARQPFGKVLRRQETSETFTTSLPGAPDGHYAVIRYRTDFAHKAKAGEIVTMDQVNGRWRPIGYFIH